MSLVIYLRPAGGLHTSHFVISPPMHVISTYLPPTAVTHAITAKLSGSSTRYLVIAKINRVEAFSLELEGLKPVAAYELWGRVVALEEIVVDNGPSSLLVITDHPDRSVLVLELDIRASSIVVTDTHSLKTVFNTPLEECRPCTIDPSRTIAAVTLFQGLAHIFTFARKTEKGRARVHISQQFDCRMRETHLASLTFLPIEDPTAPEVALLFQDKDGHRRFISYRIDFEKEDLVKTSTMPKLNFEDQDVSTLVTIANTNQAPGGVLVLGGSEIFFEQHGPSAPYGKQPQIVSNRQPDARVAWTGSDITGYGFVDDDRLLLSDWFGKLYLLSLARRGPTQFTYALSIALLGESSPAASIAYLNASVIYLASVLGDSLLLRIQRDGRLETLDSFKNVAPIRDAILADLDESGEPSIVTCSGQGNSGGLRVIRNGVDVKELATIDGVEGIRRTFTIRDPNIRYDSYLLLSLFSQSKLLNLLPDAPFEEISIQEFPGFSRAAPTIAVQELKDFEGSLTSLVVQVLPNAALLIDMNSRQKVDEWQASISLASCNPTTICLVLSTSEFVDLRVDHHTQKFHVKLRRLLDHSASVLSVRPINPGDRTIQIVTIGFWAEHVVKLYKLDGLKHLGDITGLSHAPRSVLLWKFGADDTSRLHALVGTANGNLLIAKLEVQGPNLDIKSRRTLSLGTRPVDIEGFSGTGEHVMSCGSRAIVLSWEEDREGIAYHRISTKNIENVTPINTPIFSDSFLFNMGNSLSVCKLGALKKLQIDSIPLGLDNPIQVAYYPEIKVFGVCCLREEPPNTVGIGSITSSFKLIDALTYERLDSYACEPDEEVISVSVVDLTVDGNTLTYFAAGTMVFEGDQVEPSAGRILLFEVGGNQRSRLVGARGPVLTLRVAHAIEASVIAITCIDGVLVVAISSLLGVYCLENDDIDDSLKLKPLAEWTANFLISSVVVHGHNIAVGDAMQSATILKWNGKSLKTVAKDWATFHSLSLTVDEGYIIQSEMGRNLVSHQLVGDKLDHKGYYYVGETISKLLPGKLRIAEHHEESGVTTPTAKHLLFTSGGRISIISECNYDTGMLLYWIQRNMNEVVVGHKANPKLLSWRTPSNKLKQTEMYGFIDGDFVEQYLRYSANSNEVKRILEGSNQSERLPHSEAEIRSFIQNLQRV